MGDNTLNYETKLLVRIYQDNIIKNEDITIRGLMKQYGYEAIPLVEALNHCIDIGLLDLSLTHVKNGKVNQTFNISEEGESFVGSLYYDCKKKNRMDIINNKSREIPIIAQQKSLFEL